VFNSSDVRRFITSLLLSFFGGLSMNQVIRSLAFLVAASGAFLTTSPVQAQAIRMTTDGTAEIRAGMTKQQILPYIRPQSTGVGDDPFECDTFTTRDGLASVMIERGLVTSVATDSPRFSTTVGARVGMSEAEL
jgi:hypothetical protein